MTPLNLSPVSLIKHHVLHILQLEVHLFDNVHQTTKSTDDSVEGKQRCQDCIIAQVGRVNIIMMHCSKALTCRGSHEEPQTDRPYWKRARMLKFILELKVPQVQQKSCGNSTGVSSSNSPVSTKDQSSLKASEFSQLEHDNTVRKTHL